jgi:hypothetical protein
MVAGDCCKRQPTLLPAATNLAPIGDRRCSKWSADLATVEDQRCYKGQSVLLQLSDNVATGAVGVATWRRVAASGCWRCYMEVAALLQWHSHVAASRRRSCYMEVTALLQWHSRVATWMRWRCYNGTACVATKDASELLLAARHCVDSTSTSVEERRSAFSGDVASVLFRPPWRSVDSAFYDDVASVLRRPSWRSDIRRSPATPRWFSVDLRGGATFGVLRRRHEEKSWSREFRDDGHGAVRLHHGCFSPLFFYVGR